jgi:anti-sigma regulatory factor (Ser/Thr protein kinase)
MNIHQSPSNQFKRIIKTDRSDAAALIEDAHHYLSALHDSGLASSVDSNTFHLVFDEVLSNAIQHGNRNNPDKRIAVKITPLPDNLIITVKDEGAGFSPFSISDPRNTENINKNSGRGLFILQNIAEVSWNAQGNCVTIRL